MSNLSTHCPICDAQVSLKNDLEETEIVSCLDCQSRLVVEKIENNQIVLGKAPEVEEDWGE